MYFLREENWDQWPSSLGMSWTPHHPPHRSLSPTPACRELPKSKAKLCTKKVFLANNILIKTSCSPLPEKPSHFLSYDKKVLGMVNRALLNETSGVCFRNKDLKEPGLLSNLSEREGHPFLSCGHKRRLKTITYVHILIFLRFIFFHFYFYVCISVPVWRPGKISGGSQCGRVCKPNLSPLKSIRGSSVLGPLCSPVHTILDSGTLRE